MLKMLLLCRVNNETAENVGNVQLVRSWKIVENAITVW